MLGIAPGAAGSLGLATVGLFRREGAGVTVVARDASALEGAAARLDAYAGHLMIQTADVADAGATAAFVEARCGRL